MRLTYLVATALLLTLTACSDESVKDTPSKTSKQQQAQSESSQQKPRPPAPGGSVAADPKSDAVVAAATFAAKELGGTLKSVDSAKQQVVAGKNYHMTISLQQGQVYDVTVYQRLSGKMRLTHQEVKRCGVFTKYSPSLKRCIKPIKQSPDGKKDCSSKKLKSGAISFEYYWNGKRCEKLQTRL